MLARYLCRALDLGRTALSGLRRRVLAATKPAAAAPPAAALADLRRSKPELIAENALLRQMLLVLRRSVKRPRRTPTDRALLVLLASRIRAWRSALLIVQPDTLLAGTGSCFAGTGVGFPGKVRNSTSEGAKVSDETIALIRQLAAANRLWGAERIRGELHKLDIRVAKWTVQQYMRDARPPGRAGQTWATFLRNHAGDVRACDFLPVTALLFRPLHACFIVALGSRRVVHRGVTRHPTDARVAQQRREATPFDERPRFLIRDNDAKYGPRFDHLAAASGIRGLRTPIRAPRANATCARFLGSVRRACLDHLLIRGAAHLRRVLRAYVGYCNSARPHQGIGQTIPGGSAEVERIHAGAGRIVAFPVLGGLHHDYRRAA